MSRLRPILTALCAVLLLCTAASAQTASQKSRRERLEREISMLDKQLRSNKAQSKDALMQLNLIQGKVNARQSLVKQSDAEISEITSSINAKQSQINSLQAKLDTMSLYYGDLVRRAYKNRDARIWYMYIIASDNLAQGLRRYSYLKGMSKQMNDQAARIVEAKDKLEKEKSALEEMRAKAKKLRDARAEELGRLKAEEAQAKELSDKLKKNTAKYQKDLNAKKKQADDLEREIRRSIKEAMGGTSKKSSSKGKAAPVDYKLGGEFAANKGKLPWPVEGVVVGRFGKQYHTVFKSLQLPMNNGITLATEPDAAVNAVYDGTVSKVTIFPGYHLCILVQHGNYFTLYSKMKNVYVSPGDKVKTSQALGTVDSIGGETLFHFEIWDAATTPQDPENWLRER